MGISHKFHAVTVSAILLFGATACAPIQTSPKIAAVHQKPVVVESDNLAGVIVSGANYEIIRTKQIFGTEEHDLDKLASQTTTWLAAVSHEELTRRGLRVDGGASNVRADISARCVRTSLDATEIQSLVQPVCLSRRASMVVCQHMSAELGSGEGWTAIPIGRGVQALPLAGTSGVHFRAVIRDCRSGQERWRGEVYYRGAPDAENKEFEETIRGSYRTLSFKETRR